MILDAVVTQLLRLSPWVVLSRLCVSVFMGTVVGCCVSPFVFQAMGILRDRLRGKWVM
jgi:hypothetical protein